MLFFLRGVVVSRLGVAREAYFAQSQGDRAPLRFHFLSAQTVDAARLRCDPQVFRARQAGSRQELRVPAPPC